MTDTERKILEAIKNATPEQVAWLEKTMQRVLLGEKNVVEKQYEEVIKDVCYLIDKGSAESGNYGHLGVHGHQGGSAPSDSAQQAYSATRSGGGSSVSFVGTHPKEGFMVSPYPKFEKITRLPTDRRKGVLMFRDAIKKYENVLVEGKIDTKDHFFGTWINKKKLYTDVSVNIKDKDEAVKIAKEHNQLAIWDVANMQEVKI